ncbi:MAG: Alpha-amylase, partial [Verrucomicrobiales bacterium]|nr:Alpha-amylase [Verrucomicrobiales bacterium]
PEEEFFKWSEFGFTHIWLMGVWKTGPRAREHALESFRQHWTSDPTLAGFSEADVVASPFAIHSYEVPEEFGGDEALAIFRKRLHRHGLKLLLDFVPNHVGLDHPWLIEQPALFVRGPNSFSGTFRVENTLDHIAHGKDPFFSPWADTAQLDYRNRATQRKIISLLQTIADRCDGVRCDMAMLLLHDVFAKTWAEFPTEKSVELASPENEFWAEAIQTIKAAHPEFTFMAEVYWDLEPRLQALGFDFTYNKRVYDHLLRDEYPELQERLREENIGFLARSAHFLENHDEARAARLFSFEEHLPAALLTLALPGMRLIHQGQLDGLQIHQRIQLARRPAEVFETNIGNFYERLLRALTASSVGKGAPNILRSVETRSSVVAVVWNADGCVDVAIVNLSAEPVHARFEWNYPYMHPASALFETAPGLAQSISWTDTLFHVDLAPFAAHLLRFWQT